MLKHFAFKDFISLGAITDLEILASKNNCVLWIRNRDYDKQLYVSATYQSLWGESCASLYLNPQSWKALTDSQDAKTLYNALKTNRKLICQDYTAIYHISLREGKQRWFQDRSFHLQVNTNQETLIAGCALHVPNKKMLQANQQELNEKLDFIITEYYKILMSTFKPQKPLANQNPLYKMLSKREKQIFQIFLHGKTIVQASKLLNLSPRTVEGYLTNLKNKLNCNNKSELIMKAIENGWLLVNL